MRWHNRRDFFRHRRARQFFPPSCQAPQRKIVPHVSTMRTHRLSSRSSLSSPHALCQLQPSPRQHTTIQHLPLSQPEPAPSASLRPLRIASHSFSQIPASLLQLQAGMGAMWRRRQRVCWVGLGAVEWGSLCLAGWVWGSVCLSTGLRAKLVGLRA